MTDKEVKELQDRTYDIGWSGFPIDSFFNDIRDNNNPRFNKDLAYQDFKKIIDEIYRLKEIEKQQSNPTLDECIKEWEALGYIIELGITHMWISTVDDNTIATFDLSDKCVTTSLFINYELSILIHKTLKALEEMKDE